MPRLLKRPQRSPLLDAAAEYVEARDRWLYDRSYPVAEAEARETAFRMAEQRLANLAATALLPRDTGTIAAALKRAKKQATTNRQRISA